MTVYLVRHGESELNAKKISQFPHTPLSQKGLTQAEFIGKRLEKLPIDLIISSDYTRTQQTAEIINSFVHKEIIYSEFFREIRSPSEIMGNEYEDSKTIEIREQIHNNLEDPLYHFSDEENTYDFKNRILKGIKLLEKREEKNIVLVTHGHALRMIVSLMMFGEQLTPHEYIRVKEFLGTNNTGLSIAKYYKNKWTLVTWNDHAHLADA